ncbi:MAG: DUF1679 domain-containing protein [Gammaproteobacteria bacterium]|nr:DUF1679 domain-containing protein [Gammaproteobacteria bacterium]
MNNHFKKVLLESTQSRQILSIDTIQSLWSGYGEILRCQLDSDFISSAIVKHVCFPNKKNHPRGWNTGLSHQRKVRSYQIETNWYQQWSKQCDNSCRVPKTYALESLGEEVFMVMEDLDNQGFNIRKNQVSFDEMLACLNWLASFHATFLGQKPDGLWKIGTYWHLATRPDELKVLKDKALKNAAVKIDQKLNSAQFKTFVHGDAKLANFCFSENNNQKHPIAAVDFQYIGGGCGMKDVAYFIGSCLNEDECEFYQQQLLDSYFNFLNKALTQQHKKIEFKQLQQEWRQLYPFAWTDFHRFIKGWSPGHWKINGYSERLVQETLELL